MTYLPISLQGRSRFELSYHSNLQQPADFKIVRTENNYVLNPPWLTHWGRVTHICVSKLTIIGSDNGLSPGRHQANIWTSNGTLLIGPLGTNFSEILIGIQTFSFKSMQLKMSSAKWRPFCLGLNVSRQNAILLNRCWHIANYILSDTFQWRFKPKHDKFFLSQGTAFEYVVCKMPDSLSKLHWLKWDAIETTTFILLNSLSESTIIMPCQGMCNVRYSHETHLKPKSRKI